MKNIDSISIPSPPVLSNGESLIPAGESVGLRCPHFSYREKKKQSPQDWKYNSALKLEKCGEKKHYQGHKQFCRYPNNMLHNTAGQMQQWKLQHINAACSCTSVFGLCIVPRRVNKYTFNSFFTCNICLKLQVNYKSNAKRQGLHNHSILFYLPG